MNSTQRFSNRVADYVKYRPGYPPALIDDLMRDGVLTAGSVIADIGSGTGLFAQLLLERGYCVVGVEPNGEMRRAGETFLQAFAGFASVNGAAEATTLADKSVDLVTAGQAFHWFDQPAARTEFARILRPPGWVALVWNQRLTDRSPFLAAYEKLLQQFSTDYAAVDHRRVKDEDFRAFFHPHGYTSRTYPNHQTFDYAGIKGRLLSSSYAPALGHPNHASMLAALETIFRKHHVNGKVTIDYLTEVYAGRLLAV